MGPPGRVTLLLVGVLSITILCTLRMVLALQNWAFLSELPGVSPLYQALSGLVGLLVGWPLVWGLASGQRWAPGLTRRATLAFVAFEVLERRLLFGAPQPNWFFSVVFLMLCLAFVWWCLDSPTVKLFFGEVYERKS